MANKEASLLLRIKTAGAEALDGVRAGIEKIGEVAAGVFAVVSAVIAKSIYEYSQQEQAINSLSRTMVNNGVFSVQLRDAYLAQADALAKLTLFGDDAIINAQAAFSQQARSIQLTQEQTKAILDFAQAQGMDAASAANLVGKAVGTATNALARYGIEVSSTASQSEKMTQVIAGLSSKFGGQAEAATQGLGAIQQLNKNVGELYESLGQRLAPAVGVLANMLNKIVTDSTNFDATMDVISEGFNFVSKAALGVGFVIQSTVAVFTGAFSTISESISLALDGKFGAAADAFLGHNERVRGQIEELAMSYAERIEAIDQADVDSKQQKLLQNEANLKASMARTAEVKATDAAAAHALQLERMIAESNVESEMELALLTNKQSAIAAAKVSAADRELQLATTAKEKEAALKKKYDATELLNEAKLNEAKLEMRKDTLSRIVGLQSSSNSTLAAIGKAAALTQIAIDGPAAVVKALAAFPPPFNFVAAAAVGASIASQAAQVAGIPLAEGGIVMPRPGGTQATIGEAGQAEAVIPLDRAGEFGLGGGGGSMTINVYGGILGSESDARQFAIAVDREMLKLRRNNESVSFDSGVI